MIVISTHNGRACLDRLLASFAAYGTDGSDICVVVSNDSAPEYKAYVASLVGKFAGQKLHYLCEPWGGFETGAFIYAYQQLKNATEFMFLQDSMEATGPGWLAQFREKCVNVPCVVPWITFAPYLLGCTPAVSRIITGTYGMYKEPGFGIFGSMFYTTRKTLEIVERAGYMEFIPQAKADAEASERFWALFFNRLDIAMHPVYVNGFQFIRDGGHYPLLRKHFHHAVGSARG